MLREEVRRHPLAHRASVHVGEGHDHGVDAPVGDPLVDQRSSRHMGRHVGRPRRQRPAPLQLSSFHVCTLGRMIPLIGVSTYVAEASWGRWQRRAAVLPDNYFELVAAAGGRPLLLPPPSTAPEGPGAAADEVIAVLDAARPHRGWGRRPPGLRRGARARGQRGGRVPRRQRAVAAGRRPARRPARAGHLPRLPGPQRGAGRHPAPAPARRGRPHRPSQCALRVRRRRDRHRAGHAGRRRLRRHAHGALLAPPVHCRPRPRSASPPRRRPTG